jgi:hypothetical protein
MKALIVFLLLALSAFVSWPYYQVWNLNQAAIGKDQAALADLVDIRTVREEIKRRLNKEVDSTVGEVSNSFVDWLQEGIKRKGAEAVDALVTIDWVREQLLSKSEPQDPPGFWHRISYAFFDSPSGFLVRIGELGEEPVHFRLSFQTGWKLTALYN